MSLFPLLHSRGLIDANTNTESLEQALAKPLTLYAGFDATAASLHVGHLMILRVLAIMAKHGHRAIGLVGGATTLVGDPTGRNTARPLLDAETIAQNTAKLRDTLDTLVPGITVVNNADWTAPLTLIDFLRTAGARTSVNTLIKLDTFERRLNSGDPLSVLELFYPMLQAHDFAHLAETENCTLQIGGRDQWGNILAGVDMARKLHQKTVHGLTVPLLTTASGEKMGKTGGNAVWLDASMLSVFDFWQFWRNVDDADLEKLLLLFTDIEPDACKTFAQGDAGSRNAGKILLANTVTAWVHGIEAAKASEEKAQALFSGKRHLDGDAVSLPSGTTLVKALLATSFAPSGKEAKRLLMAGAIKVDQETVFQDIPLEGTKLLSCGKKKHILVEIA